MRKSHNFSSHKISFLIHLPFVIICALICPIAFARDIDFCLETGDLIFVQSPSQKNDFSNAIQQTGLATVQWLIGQSVNIKKHNQRDVVDHVAIVIQAAPYIILVDATPKDGVRFTTLKKFVQENPKAIFYQAKPLNISSINKARAAFEAFKKLGSPYANNFEPFPSNSFYCSSLIVYAYEVATSNNKTFFTTSFKILFEPVQFWNTYYQNLGEKVPKNITGSNPTLLLHSPKWIYRKVYFNPIN